jgi:hypothetical protein
VDAGRVEGRAPGPRDTRPRVSREGRKARRRPGRKPLLGTFRRTDTDDVTMSHDRWIEYEFRAMVHEIFVFKALASPLKRTLV